MSRRGMRLSEKELALLRPQERCVVDAAGVHFAIQRELKNYNASNRNPHWSKKHKGLKVWQAALNNAMVLDLGFRRACELLSPESGLHGARGARCAERRHIEILRLVPSRRNFVRDTFENLPWAAKELRDALKHTGLIHDDSDKWTTCAIDQNVSDDGTFWTLISIRACVDAPMNPFAPEAFGTRPIRSPLGIAGQLLKGLQKATGTR